MPPGPIGKTFHVAPAGPGFANVEGATVSKMRPAYDEDGEHLIGLVRRLVIEEGFSPEDFVIAGSARLWTSGHRDRISDIDIVARGATWSRALELVESGHGYLETTDISGATVVRLCGGLIEVADHWFMEDSDTDELIDSADVIDGLPYFGYAEIIAYKLRLNRPKDRADLVRMGLLEEPAPQWRYGSSRIDVPRRWAPREAGHRRPEPPSPLTPVGSAPELSRGLTDLL